MNPCNSCSKGAAVQNCVLQRGFNDRYYFRENSELECRLSQSAVTTLVNAWKSIGSTDCLDQNASPRDPFRANCAGNFATTIRSRFAVFLFFTNQKEGFQRQLVPFDLFPLCMLIDRVSSHARGNEFNVFSTRQITDPISNCTLDSS